MELNIISIFYLFFRLAPFIITAYFALQSIFNQDLKGLIFLVGLLITAFLTIFIGNILPQSEKEQINLSTYAQAICNQLTLGASGPISRLPLSQTVYGYTLAYLSYFIGTNNLVSQNIPTFIMFPILIIGDIFWSTSNGCSTNIMLITSLIIGGIIGTLWAMIIEGTKVPDLAYFSGISNKDVCSRPTKSLYRCRAVNRTQSAA
jgi:hypothetical protein|tara:strand:+ start:414 stop:1025 length:612 start_codon:yes stop_codon:yes gene_type:complete